MNLTTDQATAGPSPGLRRKPSHTVRVEKQHRQVTVTVGEVKVAETRNAVTLYEADYQPVQYIPIEDVNQAYLELSGHTTDCPYKGVANYWSLNVAGRHLKNVVWHYPNPYDEVAGLKGHVSFYLLKVNVKVMGL